MTPSADRMIADLDAFVADPTDVATLSNLYVATKGFDALAEADKARVVPAMFRVMEKWPKADLGTPGPMVHAIESLGVPEYEAMLVQSVRRQPMYLNLWMVNRILNIAPDGPQRAALLALFRDVRDDPKWAGQVSDEAADYLEHQGEAD
jgi:hypothetical protein